MKRVFVYTILVIALQLLIAVCVALGVRLAHMHDSEFTGILYYVYWPVITPIGKLVTFRGEEAIIAPVRYGVALGILLYGFVFELIAYSLRRTVRHA